MWLWVYSLLVLMTVAGHPLRQQSTPPLTAQALLQQSVVAMGGSIPADSVARGSITIIAGSLTQNGNIQIETRGVEESLEQIQGDKSETIVFSYGQASKTVEGTVGSLPAEEALTSQSPDFPLPLIANALDNPDEAYAYVGVEDINGTPVQHIQLWDSFSSQPALKALSECSKYDIWLDSTSYLPVRISYQNWWGRGAVPRPRYDVFFSDYQKPGTVLYPFSIKKSLNGMPWETITIQDVAFNTGLTDSDFQIQ